MDMALQCQAQIMVGFLGRTEKIVRIRNKLYFVCPVQTMVDFVAYRFIYDAYFKMLEINWALKYNKYKPKNIFVIWELTL